MRTSVLLLALATGAPAPVGGAGASHSPSQQEPAGVEAFFDGMIRAHLRERDIAGATLAVVHRGEVVAARGYGFGEVAERRPVDPALTLFRIGSVTKLFTSVAVMQLVEAGLVELDADVNGYLDFPVPATFPEPITVAHLLTHTAGFQDDLRDLFTFDPERVVPLGDWVRENLPVRVRPPGHFSAYSNYGMALLGRVVEGVSGLSWDDYLESRILEPLGMTHTTGRQPLPERLAPHMSGGYVPSRGGFEARPFEITVGADPAGSISSTATDMAAFMLALLGGGALGEARILEEETVRTMMARRFHHDPRLPGYGLGFYEMDSHGVRIVGHGGDTGWFHTHLALFPEHDLGFFVSYNTSTGAQVSFAPVLLTFLDQYFPVPPPEAGSPDPGLLSTLAGSYRFNRTSETTFQKVAGLALTASVRAGEGALEVTTPIGRMRMVEVDSLLFQEERGTVRMAFRTDEAGRPTHAFLSLTPMMALERVPWHGLPALHLPILGGGMLLFLAMLVAGVVGWVRRRVRGRVREWEEPRTEPRALVVGRRSLLLTAAANVAFVATVAILFAVLDLWGFFTTPMTGFAVALTLPVLGAVAAVAAAVAVAVLWRRREGSAWLRIRYSLAVVVALLFVWSQAYWNLLGWRL